MQRLHLTRTFTVKRLSPVNTVKILSPVNMQGFAWKFFYFYVLYKESLFIHSIREPVWPSGKALGW